MTFSPQFLDEIRARVPLAETIGRRVRLARRGREHVGLCPFHNEKTPSFTVSEDKGFFHCFGCGAHGDVIDFIMRIDNLTFPEAVDRLAAEAGIAGDRRGGAASTAQPTSTTSPTPKAVLTDDERRRIEAARVLWRRARPVAGTIAEIYLKSRGLTLDPPPSLRYLANAKHPITHVSLAALIVGVTRWPDRRVISIQRTFLRADGQGKASVSEPRMSLAPTTGGAVRLAAVGHELGLCEGVEDALAVLQATGIPMWACLGKGGLRAVIVPPLPLAAKVTIFADLDPNGGGEAAARELAERLVNDGRRVAIARPPIGSDFNDTLIAGGQTERAA